MEKPASNKAEQPGQNKEQPKKVDEAQERRDAQRKAEVAKKQPGGGFGSGLAEKPKGGAGE